MNLMKSAKSPMPVLLAALMWSGATALAADPEPDLVRQAKAALKKGDKEAALKLAAKLIESRPDDPQSYFFRASMNESLQRHKEAIADLDKIVALDPKNADAYDARGSEYFKLADIAKSIQDFDKFLELKPDAIPGHWRRGISYYYAGKYEEGKRQFEGYQTVDNNDVENVVWRYLCMARSVGVAKARDAMLKVGQDRRIPMMTIYELYCGRAKPADVLTAATANVPPQEQRQALFYAHLYLGLYYDAAGDKKRCLDHIRQAAEKYPATGYMWDVARVHLLLLQKSD